MLVMRGQWIKHALRNRHIDMQARYIMHSTNEDTSTNSGYQVYVMTCFHSTVTFIKLHGYQILNNTRKPETYMIYFPTVHIVSSSDVHISEQASNVACIYSLIICTCLCTVLTFILKYLHGECFRSMRVCTYPTPTYAERKHSC